MRSFLLTAFLTLCACGSVVTTTALQLANLSPLTADPADFAVKITVPTGLDVAPNSATLLFTGQETPDSEPVTGTYILERQGDVFRIAPSDLALMRAQQAQFNTWETADSDAASGSLSVGIQACGDPSALTLDSRVSVAIQITKGGVFLPLIRNAPLSSVVAQEELDALEACP